MTGASINILPREMLELIVGYLPHADGAAPPQMSPRHPGKLTSCPLRITVYACLTLDKHFHSVCKPALYASAHIEIAIRAQCSHIDDDGEDYDEAAYGGKPCTYTFKILNNHEKLLDCIDASERILALAALIPSLAITCTGGTLLRDATCKSKDFKDRLAKVTNLLTHLHPTRFLFVGAARYITLKKTFAKAVNVDRLTKLVLPGEDQWSNDSEHTFILLQRAQSALTSAILSGTALRLPERVASPSLSKLRHLSIAGIRKASVDAIISGVIKQAPNLEHISFPRNLSTSELQTLYDVAGGVKGCLRALSLSGIDDGSVLYYGLARHKRDLTSLPAIGRFALHNVYYGNITSLFPPGIRHLYVGDIYERFDSFAPTRAAKDIVPVLEQFITLLETPLWQPDLEELTLVFLVAARALEECACMCNAIEELAASRGIKLLTKRRKALGQGTWLQEAGYRYEKWARRAKNQARARSARSKGHDTVVTKSHGDDTDSHFDSDF